MSLEGKSIRSVIFDEAEALDVYGIRKEGGGKEDRMILTFTDGTSAVISAYIHEADSQLWGNDARLSVLQVGAEETKTNDD
jgi:hypothetical protein